MELLAKQLHTTKRAADVLEVSPSLMKRWRATGQGPRFVVLGVRLIRYRSEDLLAYMDTLTGMSSKAEVRAEEKASVGSSK